MGSSWETTGRWFKQQMPKMYDSKCQTRRELGLREQWVDAQRGERKETVGIYAFKQDRDDGLYSRYCVAALTLNGLQQG